MRRSFTGPNGKFGKRLRLTERRRSRREQSGGDAVFEVLSVQGAAGSSGTVLSDWGTRWVNSRSTGFRHQTRSQQKRFHAVMPLCELTREHANPAGSTLNPKVAGSIPARPITKTLQISSLVEASVTRRWTLSTFLLLTQSGASRRLRSLAALLRGSRFVVKREL
jgi:hypothetical protein